MPSLDLDPSAQETANILAASSAFLKWRAVEDSGGAMPIPVVENEMVPISAVAAAVGSSEVASEIPDVLAKASLNSTLEKTDSDPFPDVRPLQGSSALEPSKLHHAERACDSMPLPNKQQTDVLLAQQKSSSLANPVAITTRPVADTIEPSLPVVDGTSAQTAEPAPVAA